MKGKLLRSPLIVVPALVVGAYHLTGNDKGAGQAGQLTLGTYGTVTGVGLGSMPAGLTGLGNGLKAAGGGDLSALGGQAGGALPGGGANSTAGGAKCVDPATGAVVWATSHVVVSPAVDPAGVKGC